MLVSIDHSGNLLSTQQVTFVKIFYIQNINIYQLLLFKEFLVTCLDDDSYDDQACNVKLFRMIDIHKEGLKHLQNYQNVPLGK